MLADGTVMTADPAIGLRNVAMECVSLVATQFSRDLDWSLTSGAFVVVVNGPQRFPSASQSGLWSANRARAWPRSAESGPQSSSGQRARLTLAHKRRHVRALK